MATSGTIGATVFETRKVIDSAFRRCRIPAQAVTSEMIDNASDQLWLFLSSMQGVVTPLWAQDRQIVPLVEGQVTVTLPTGTIDVVNANRRTVHDIDGSITTASDRVTFDAGEATRVATIGFSLASGTFALIIESSDDNATWTARETLASSAYTTGEVVWTDIDPTAVARYWRVRETSGAAITVSGLRVANSPREIKLARVSLDVYANLPDRTVTGTPNQFWLDRQHDRPVMHIWPTPDATSAADQIVVWRERHIMDVGTLRQTLEIPARWYEAIIAGLAYRIAEDTAMVDLSILPLLKMRADETFRRAATEERDSSPIMLQAGIGAYTR